MNTKPVKAFQIYVPGFFILIFLLFLLPINALAEFSGNGRNFFSMSQEDEIEIGKKADKDIVKTLGLIKNKKIIDYVNSIGQKIVNAISNPEFEYHFKIIDTKDVNAFALPGGYVYITRGMLALIGSDAELAVILGHEIGHITSHHGVKQMKKMQAASILTLLGMIATINSPKDATALVVSATTLSQHILSGYGRDAERQSDLLSIVYTHKAGYDPRVISKFFKKLKSLERFSGRSYHGFMASHPDTIERIISSEQKAESITEENSALIINENDYLEIINGLPYGQGEGRKNKKTDHMIQTYKVVKEEKLKNIVNNITGDPTKTLEIALINGIKVNAQLKPGDNIKLIVKAVPEK